MPKTQSIVGGELYPARVLRDTPVGYWRLDDVDGYAQAVVSDRPVGYWRLGEAEGYAQAVISDTPAGYWRLGDSEGYAQAVISDGPIAYWRLEESSGTTAADATGHGHTITLPGSGITYSVAGALINNGTKGFGLSGSQNRASFTGIAIGTSCSFEFWFKPTAGSLQYALILGVSGGGAGLYFDQTRNKINLQVGGGGAGDRFNSTALTPGTLYHVVVSIAAGAATFYINGAADGTASGWPGITADSAFNVGGSPGGAPLTATLVDEVAIYGYALSAQQVANHYGLQLSTLTSTAAATVVDSSGNGRTGTIAGGVTLVQTGALGDGNPAALFDGASGVISTAGAAAFSANAMSIEVWFKPLTLPAGRTELVEIGIGGVRALELQHVGDVLNFICYYADGTNSDLQSGLKYTGLTIGSWYHVAATHDGATTRLYLNGAQVGSFAKASNVKAVTNPAVFVGALEGPSQFANDKIDEVAVYTYALSAAQVANHWGLRNSFIATTAAATVADSSGNGYTGTVRRGVTLQQAALIADGDTAALFDGVDGTRITAPGAAIDAISGTSFYSFEAWVKTPAAGALPNNFRMFLSFPNQAATYLALHDGNGFWRFVSENWINGGPQREVAFGTSGAPVQPNTWYHVVVTYDNATLRLYINGTQWDANPIGAGTILLNTGGVWIGGWNQAGAYTWSGLIDEVAIYNYTLSAAQVANHYALRTSTIGTVAAATVADSTANAIAGTVHRGVTLQQTSTLADGDKAAAFDGSTTGGSIIFGSGYSAVGVGGTGPAALRPGLANFSIEAFFKRPAGIAASEFLWSQDFGGGADAGGCELFMTAAGAFNSRLGATTTASATGFADGAWHHVVLSVNRAGNAQIYVDGVASGAAVDVSAQTANLSASGPSYIGRRQQGNYFNGSLDEVAFYTVALTAEQAAAHYFNRLAVTSGLRAGGAAPFAFKRAIVGTGGVVASGAAAWRRGRVRVGSGGLRIGGVSPVVRTKAFHYVANGERVVDVLAESTTVVVEAESRVVVVPFENRVDAVPAEV